MTTVSLFSPTQVVCPPRSREDTDGPAEVLDDKEQGLGKNGTLMLSDPPFALGLRVICRAGGLAGDGDGEGPAGDRTNSIDPRRRLAS